jgi:hypothetical protein
MNNLDEIKKPYVRRENNQIVAMTRYDQERENRRVLLSFANSIQERDIVTIGLKGEEIPLSARILTVADVYDVLTSQRPYKAALSEDAARERLLLGSGAYFDPMIVHAFLNLLDSQPDFTLPQRICAIPAVTKHTYQAASIARV